MKDGKKSTSKDPEDEEKENVKILVKSCITSNKGGVLLRCLSDDYYSLTGEQIPYTQFGYKSLSNFLEDIPGMKFEKKRDGDILLTVKSEKSRHLQELIENQRDKTHKKSRYQIPHKAINRYSNKINRKLNRYDNYDKDRDFTYKANVKSTSRSSKTSNSKSEARPDSSKSFNYGKFLSDGKPNETPGGTVGKFRIPKKNSVSGKNESFDKSLSNGNLDNSQNEFNGKFKPLTNSTRSNESYGRFSLNRKSDISQDKSYGNFVPDNKPKIVKEAYGQFLPDRNSQIQSNRENLNSKSADNYRRSLPDKKTDFNDSGNSGKFLPDRSLNSSNHDFCGNDSRDPRLNSVNESQGRFLETDNGYQNNNRSSSGKFLPDRSFNSSNHDCYENHGKFLPDLNSSSNSGKFIPDRRFNHSNHDCYENDPRLKSNSDDNHRKFLADKNTDLNISGNSEPDMSFNSNDNFSCANYLSDPRLKSEYLKNNAPFEPVLKLDYNHNDEKSHAFSNSNRSDFDSSMEIDRIQRDSDFSKFDDSGIDNPIEELDVVPHIEINPLYENIALNVNYPYVGTNQLIGDDFFLQLCMAYVRCYLLKVNDDAGVTCGTVQSGSTIKNMYLRLTKIENMSNKIMICIGALDVYQGADSKDMIEHMKDLLGLLHEKFEYSPSAITLCTIPPLIDLESEKSYNKLFNLRNFNTWIRKISKKCNYKIIDFNQEYVNNDNYTGNTSLFEKKPTSLIGCNTDYVFWNYEGRQKAINLILDASYSTNNKNKPICFESLLL